MLRAEQNVRRATSFSVWALAAYVIAALMALPLIALFVIALSGNLEALSGLATTVMPRASLTTALLLIGLALMAGSIGAVSAWLVTFFEFPFRRVFAWALMLPLAVPTYISAYTFTEFFTFTGPVQGAIRFVWGFESARDYWFPEIRSLPGAIFVMSLVLYPYVYLSVRTLFHLQGKRAVEAAMILGARPHRAFLSILLPLARPALVLGVTLAMMEALNDIGAMEHLGVQTLTFSVFSVWLNQGDIAGAAQLAMVLLAFVFALIIIERVARRQQNYASSQAGAGTKFERQTLSPWGRTICLLAVSVPVLLGFGIPFGVLALYASRYIGSAFDAQLSSVLVTSVSLAFIAALVTVVFALALTFAARTDPGRRIARLNRIASIGYAVPGTIIALGLFLPLARFDNFIDGISRAQFDVVTGLLLTGSGATLIYAYVVRFMAIAEGNIEAAFLKISENLDHAAIVAGMSKGATLTRILMPLSRPAIAIAALLVFIETLKELSATMLLRPFGLETLAIYVHDLAARGRIEQGAFAALLILVAGLVPVILLTQTAFGASSKTD